MSGITFHHVSIPRRPLKRSSALQRFRRFLRHGDVGAQIASFSFWATMVIWLTIALVGTVDQSILSGYWPTLGFSQHHLPTFGNRA